ncbi:MAG TPA: hypothetical protein VHC90_19205, partial [Bryobacteraceae bacterium]|nr:hypothetical protein [Bryobacteraceae bacterium]
MSRKHQLPLDPEKSAAAAGLRYGGHECAGIIRQKHGKGFVYLADGKPVRDAETLARIRSLVLPPAWTNVWICRDPLGHLQAIGYDARGRRQYRYHPAYRQIRNLTKFERMPDVVSAITAARAKVREHLSLPGMPR